MRIATTRLTAALAGLALTATGAWAGDRTAAYYEVSVTNLTRGQVFSPPLVVTHPQAIALFEPGEPASDGLAALAQDGDNGPLSAALADLPGVHAVSAAGPVPPGETVSVRVGARSPRAVLSVAAMLVTTNDAFLAVSGQRLPAVPGRRLATEPDAYDAGAEPNDELCAFIPGPPCGNAFAASGLAGEGYVHIHAGIHGIGDLDPAARDWRNPVAVVTVRRVPAP